MGGVTEMSNPLFLFVGKSGSGKTTIANLLSERYGHNQVESYTTRPPRYDGEIGHIFVSKEEFDHLGELAAYTLYNGNEYGTTLKQLEDYDIYVIDIPGVETLLQNSNFTRPVRVIYFDTTVPTRIRRMLDRGDCDTAIVARLMQDEEYDWQRKLTSLVWHYLNLEHKDVEMYTVNANDGIEKVVELVRYFMNQHMEV